jgi:hypothetical protein
MRAVTINFEFSLPRLSYSLWKPRSALFGTSSTLVSRRHSPISADNRRCESLKLLEMVAKLASISPNSDTRIYYYYYYYYQTLQQINER